MYFAKLKLCSQLCINILKPDCCKYHVLIMCYYCHIEILFKNLSFMILVLGAIYNVKIEGKFTHVCFKLYLLIPNNKMIEMYIIIFFEGRNVYNYVCCKFNKFYFWV